MSDSNARDILDRKHERIRERRVEALKRWVDYLKTEPPETWGPQLNALVEAQLEAARHAGISAAHQQRVRTVADEIIDARDEPETE